MVHELPTRLFRYRHGPAVFRAVVVLFLLVQLGLALRLVAPEPFRGPLPWHMFHAPSPHHQFVSFSGIAANGEARTIDATRWFRFRSGASRFPTYVRHPALWGSTPWKQRNQRVLARWLAHKTWVEDGVRLREVRIEKRRVNIRTGAVRLSKVRTIAIEESDLERSVPAEAWAVHL